MDFSIGLTLEHPNFEVPPFFRTQIGTKIGQSLAIAVSTGIEAKLGAFIKINAPNNTKLEVGPVQELNLVKFYGKLRENQASLLQMDQEALHTAFHALNVQT